MTDPACVLYHRVSTLDQDAGLARVELQRAAELRGLRVLASVEETGSGANNDRPGLARALEVATKEGAAVLVWKLDRFGRSALDVQANIRRLTDAGCRFVAVTQGLDVHPGADAVSRLIMQVLAAVAEFERELIRERTCAGLARARARGRRPGRPSESTPEQAQAVREARAAGLSWARTARMVGVTVGTARRLATMGGASGALALVGREGGG